MKHFLLNAVSIAVALVLASPHAFAVKKVYKHDQFMEDMVTAGSQITGAPTFVSPGFAKNEAWGQIYKPGPSEYPVKILGVDLFLAAPPKGDLPGTTAIIELWFTDGDGPAPDKTEPTFKIDTNDLFNPGTGNDGLILTGGKAAQIDFDWDDPGGHPPMLLSGNVIVMVRFPNAPKSLATEWNQAACTKEITVGWCGCQPVGTISDGAITLGANVMNILSGGVCLAEASQWVFAENLGIKGDFILRMRADVPTAFCFPSCAGKSCGSDGCGGSCGTCASGESCQSGQCIPGGCTSQCSGKECGSDGCGGVCGSCGSEMVCVQGKCTKAQGCETQCDGKQCGDDGCGGICGLCSGGSTCVEGICKTGSCIPNCDSKTCGDDGCGGTCGDCSDSETCASGTCVLVSIGDVVVTTVSPASGYDNEQTEISVFGSGFKPDATVRVGGTVLIAVQVSGDGLATGTVPKGMTPGKYAVVVANQDGSSGFLVDGFEIEARLNSAPDGNSGCAIQSRSSTSVMWLLVVAVLLLAAFRTSRTVRAR
jgi:hypothetical protein